MKKLHRKTKLRSMFALFLSVMLLIGIIPVKALGESIGSTDSSIIEVPDGEVPDGEVPDGEVPDGEVPDGEVPDGEVPDGEVPDGEVPDDEVPDGEVPDGEVPDGEVPDGEVPDGEVLDGDKEDVNEEDEAGAFVLDLASLNFDFSKINANDALMKFLAKDVEVDMNDPVIGQVAEELDNSDLISGNETNSGMMKRSLMTADESSETKGLTEEEKAKILDMFAGYLQNYADSAPVLGVQLPFFLNENDNEEDGLGVLGEMLVLAGNTVAEVRNGEQTYDEISGMILTLMLGDQLGVHCYEDVIIGLRDEALDAVKESSAKTEAQKLLVLNDWLATKVTFNMSYIMNADGSEAMQAEEPQPHNNYDTVYGTVYNMYKEAILEDLKNAAKEQYPYEIFLGHLKEEVGEEYFASMTEEDKKAAYENAILDILASDEFTQQLGMHYEEFVDLNAKGAADSLTPAIFNYWGGSIFGTLGEGSAVCLGYARAYAYLVQCLHPEIYLKEGNDLNSADNWKSNKDIYFDENNEIKTDQGYLVDAVRVTFDADVTMFGQTQENFNSDHFWNAIRVDGQWYYIDPSYNDIYVEVMLRDRVETDGNMSHLYFLLSDTTTRELYEGNYSEIKTLYEGVATDDSYEDSWMVRSISNIFSDKNYFYYVYSSQDLIDQLREHNSESSENSMNNDYEYKLVRHEITGVDTPNTDTDFDSLIEFNYRESEDDKESYARIWNGSEMVKDDYLTALYAEHKAMAEIYPSITISTVLHNNKLYFNLSNLILSYDLGENSYAIEKEMDTISVTRDKKVAFGGMSFSYSDGKSEGADFVLDNHPIAAIALGKGGQLKVSMATNLAYISGKDDGEYEDDLSTIRQGAYTEDREGFYGYAFEETNYNTAYSTYSSDKYEGFVNKEINDNDEFMWVANAVNQYQFSELAGTSTEGKEFIGVLCKDEEHAYVEHDEIYFTKDDDKKWNIGAAYVCVTCGHSVFEPTEPTDLMVQFYPEAKEEYQRKLDAYEAAKEESQKSYKLEGAQWADDYTSVTFSTLNCKYSFDDYQLDVLYNLKPVELDEPIVIDAITKTENDDGSITYTADSSAIEDYSGYEYYVSITVDKDVVDPDPTDPVDPDPTDPTDPVDPDPTDPTDPVDPDPTDPTDPVDPDPTDPTDPVDPDPTDPTDPVDPDPTDPTDPVDPDPTDPTDPVDPDPTDPVDPDPTDPTDPVDPDPTDPTDPVEPGPTTPVVPKEDGDTNTSGGGGGGGGGGSSGSSTSTPRPITPVVPEEVIITEERVPLAPPYIGFKDVLENAWYYGAVRQVTTSGLFVGISEDLFGPNMAVTRGMFVTVLSRVEFDGSDKVPSGTSHFTDLSQDWYKDSVAWAAANKITYGTSDTKFSPDDLITREQMIVMLHRYAMYKGYDMSHSAGALSNFGDKNMVTKANETAMEWAIKHGLISGMNPTTLAPRGETTRAQLATVMIRFIDYSESGVSGESLGGFDNLPIFYKLTFETNGGSNIESVSKARGTTIKLDKYHTFRDGYTFLSWYADKELTEKITSVRLIENTTIYVKWEKN